MALAKDQSEGDREREMERGMERKRWRERESERGREQIITIERQIGEQAAPEEQLPKASKMQLTK